MEQTNCAPPQEFIDANAGAPEASNPQVLHGCLAVIKMGGTPAVAVENMNISEAENKSPIFVCGSLFALGYDQSGITVNVSGQIVQLAKSTLANSAFYPQSEKDLMKNLNKVFEIDVYLQDLTKEKDSVLVGPVYTVKNCQKSGKNFALNPSTAIRDSFTAIGSFVTLNPTSLAGFGDD
ncbi:MAG: hypothetical protein GY866_30470 [Proteobacteria bacterium]|nr:hypothetical protein [Pseudomonadota bacterium]